MGILLALFMSTCGWGGLIARWAFPGDRQPAAFTAAIGTAFLIFLGGILNIVNAVGPTVIDILIIAGVGLTLIRIFTHVRHGRKFVFPVDRPGFWVMGIITAFYVYSLFPMGGFNYHDDHHAYLIFPFRMLQTGTAVSSLDALLGFGSLNAQAFLHAILLRYLPIGFINSFDILFCFMVSGLLLNEIGRKAGLHWAYRLVPLIVFIVINSQYVNISSIYSGSLMIMGLVYGSMLAFESDAVHLKSLVPRMVPMMLFAAAAAVLKMTFIGFVAVYLTLLVLFLPFLGWRFGQALKVAAVIAGLFVVFSLPWLMISLESFLGLMGTAAKVIAWQATENITGTYTHIDKVYTPMGLFSTERLYWGGSYIGYMLMIAAFAVFSGILIGRMVFKPGQHEDNRKNRSNEIIAVSAFLAVVISTFLLAMQVRPDLAIRYSCPVFIAVFPLMLPLLGSSFSLSAAADTRLQATTLGGVLIAGQLLVIGQFIDVFSSNLTRAYEQRSLLSFPVWNDKYLKYIYTSVKKKARDDVRRAQNKIPEGETLFAWLATPFHLNFARNQIVAMNTPGLTALAKLYDYSAGPRGFEAFLRANGIRYLIWSKNSYGMRSKQMLRKELDSPRRESAQHNLDLINAMEWLMKNRIKLYEERGIVVIDIGEGP